VGNPNAPVIVKSVKQKSVANSSTAAELIAFSTTLEEVLWLTQLLEELGFPQECVQIEQDNTSTVHLIEKGPSSAGRTKWMSVKHFWITEWIEKGKIKLKDVRSEDSYADAASKPTGKKIFFRFRARVMNTKARDGI